ncbi:MAG: Agglutinin receptor [Chlamydiae bacterium]|nr:Agglutinin receptor [Chlamydiota bacterium]
MTKSRFNFSSVLWASIFATVMMTIVMSLFGMNIILFLGKTAGMTGNMAYLVGGVIHFAVGIFYGLLYAWLFEPWLKRLPGFIAGALYSLLPFAIAMMFMAPMLNIVKTVFGVDTKPSAMCAPNPCMPNAKPHPCKPKMTDPCAPAQSAGPSTRRGPRRYPNRPYPYNPEQAGAITPDMGHPLPTDPKEQPAPTPDDLHPCMPNAKPHPCKPNMTGPCEPAQSAGPFTRRGPRRYPPRRPYPCEPTQLGAVPTDMKDSVPSDSYMPDAQSHPCKPQAMDPCSPKGSDRAWLISLINHLVYGVFLGWLYRPRKS